MVKKQETHLILHEHDDDDDDNDDDDDDNDDDDKSNLNHGRVVMTTGHAKFTERFPHSCF
jgi:hypothetical protein